MNIPFSVQEFLSIFAEYNMEFQFMPIIMYILGITSVVLLITNRTQFSRIISGILCFFWVWIGLIYQIKFFSTINPAAIVFGILFIIEGALFFFFGTWKNKLIFTFSKDLVSAAGGLLIIYALIIYPIFGYFAGHHYPFSPLFGMAPCPTVIFTFGILLLNREKTPTTLLIQPTLWAVIGLSAAIQLHIYEDFGLIASAIIALWLFRRKNKTISTTPIQTANA